MATSKKKKATSSDIEDIDHEHVPADRAPAVTQPEEAVVVAAQEDPAQTLELTVQREIKRFGLADAKIEELKKTYGELSIADAKDKAGYEAVKRAWNDVRSKRTGLEKKGLEIRNSYNLVAKRVKGEEDRLVDLLEPLEDELYKKWKKVDDDKEAEKQRLIKEEQDRLNARVEELVDAGCKFTDGYYGIGGTIAIDVATLRAMPLEQYEKLKVAVVAKADELAKEQARLDEEKRLADEKLAADQKRLKDEQAKLDQEKADQEKERVKLEQEKKEMAEQKREIRLDRLGALGMTPTVHKTVSYDNGFAKYELKLEEVENATEVEFKLLVATAKDRVAECQKKLADHEAEQEKERKALEAKKVYINDLLIAAGLTYQYGTECFTFKNDFLEYTKHIQELVPLEEEAIGALAERLTTQIAEAKDKQQAKEKKDAADQEKERKAKLDDRELMVEYLTALGAVPTPALKSKTMQVELSKFCSEFAILMDKFRPVPEAVPA